MRSETLIKTFMAPAAVEGHCIVTLAAGLFTVQSAGAVTDPLIGVTTRIGSQDNGRCDVIAAGFTEVKIGGAVTRGDSLTTDASGRAVTAAGTDRVIGIALQDAVADDIAAIMLGQG
jgi:hypothetical protein